MQRREQNAPGLYRNNCLHQVLGLRVLKRNRSIPVQAKDLGGVDKRQLVNVIPHALHATRGRRVVLSILCISVLVAFNGRVSDVGLQDGGNATLIHVVGHASAVVDVADDVLQRLVGDALLLVEVHA
jgi:hypothetical protein